MTTVISVDVLEQNAAMHSSTLPTMSVRLWEGEELPPADVTITVARSLPAHLIRDILNTAADRLCADDVPRLRPPPRRVA